MSLLNLNFFIIYIIHKTLALFKNHLNYFKDSISECFLRSIIVDFSFLKREIFFSQHIMMESSRSEEDYIIKEIRNLLILIKEINHTAIKGIRNLIRLQKEIKTIKDRILRATFGHEGEENE